MITVKQQNPLFPAYRTTLYDGKMNDIQKRLIAIKDF